MTIGEFKAFLEGMGVKDAPTPEQWARIKEKIDQLQALSYSPTPLAPIPSIPDRIYIGDPVTC